MSANTVIVGTPSLCLDGWTRTEVCFHGFSDLSTTRDEEVASPIFSCFGHTWLVELYPGGDEKSNDGYVAIDLGNMSNEAIKIQYGFSVRDAAGKEIVYHKPKTNEFGACDPDGDNVQNAWFNANFAKRSTLMNALIEGAFVIEVRMKLVEASKYSSQFIPENPLNKFIMNKFNDED